MTGLCSDPSDDGAATDAAAGNGPLLAFLAQPRRRGEVMFHFGPHAGVALKRLSRLLVLGQVEQLGFGVFVRAGCSWEAWPLPLRQAKLLAVLVHPMHLLDAAERAGMSSGAANAMAGLVAAGRVRCGPGAVCVRTATATADPGGTERSEAPCVPDTPGAAISGKRGANRAQLLAVLSGAWSVAEVAGLMGSSQSSMRARLARMAALGQAIRVGYGLYAAPSPGNQLDIVTGPHARPQPIRDAILAFLSEPRQAQEVAAHIGRNIPNATGHLTAMCRRGVAVRVGYGRYERVGPAQVGVRQEAIIRPFAVRDAVVAHLGQAAHHSEIARAAGRAADSTLRVLCSLVRSGLAVRCSKGVFAAAGGNSPGPRRSGQAVRATRGDACAPTSEETQCAP